MNTKNYDFIQRAIVRLNALLDTNTVSAKDEDDIVESMRLLRRVLNRNETANPTNSEEIRTD